MSDYPGRQGRDFWKEFERLSVRSTAKHDGAKNWNADWEPEFDRRKRERDEQGNDANGSS